MKILSIETSCDETSVALVEAKGGLKYPEFKVIENIVSSQIAVHRPFGGVVPNLAKREHLKNLPKILQKLKIKNLKFKIDAVAVTVGPGLEPALWTGIEYAKQLSKDLNKPLIGANHMEGHLYSNWLPRKIAALASTRRSARNDGIRFPAIALVVSGGHTILLKMDSLTKWKNLGETLDDAAGEAFDKVARMLKLPYPGGPEIQKLALRQAQGKHPKGTIKFPRPMLRDDNYKFSFSGLKTSVLYYLRDNPKAKKEDVAASFQQAVLDVLVGKTMRAARAYRAKSVLLCGGVSANVALRESLKESAEKYGMKFFVPEFEYNTDNAAMIAAAAYIQYLRKKKLKLEANSNLSL
ncbi:MAG: tRNA N6-adenosine threonylcarbamoyltransferase [Parcubacteria group bacterium Gr01-1014_3]|nr:MAG: tRNA N6-adenosine threonylcarbamoyltransferase [Parcubacteria group bacterium Gr01-1014_3]